MLGVCLLQFGELMTHSIAIEHYLQLHLQNGPCAETGALSQSPKRLNIVGVVPVCVGDQTRQVKFGIWHCRARQLDF
jgi:hypothetical protein